MIGVGDNRRMLCPSQNFPDLYCAAQSSTYYFYYKLTGVNSYYGLLRSTLILSYTVLHHKKIIKLVRKAFIVVKPPSLRGSQIWDDAQNIEDLKDLRVSSTIMNM
jgi:hypothetical protein